MENTTLKLKASRKELFNKKEELLKEAVIYAIGENWTEEEVKKRAHSATNATTKEETFFIDGVPLLVFTPFEVEYTSDTENHIYGATLSFKYEILYKRIKDV